MKAWFRKWFKNGDQFSYFEEAINDAIGYLENVTDDRDNSPISLKRRDEIIKILSEIVQRGR